VLNNPYGIDNMYVAALTPLVVMGIERAFAWQAKPVAAQ
jgi:SSS family solute:Na+ symporter